MFVYPQHEFIIDSWSPVIVLACCMDEVNFVLCLNHLSLEGGESRSICGLHSMEVSGRLHTQATLPLEWELSVVIG